MNQEFTRKKDKALSILERTNIRPRNYLPPTYPILWKMGFEVPPPHFMRFHSVLLLTGVPFGVSWIGFAMMLSDSTYVSPYVAAGVFLAISVAMGFLIATYYKAGRIFHRLPTWDDL